MQCYIGSRIGRKVISDRTGSWPRIALPIQYRHQCREYIDLLPTVRSVLRSDHHRATHESWVVTIDSLVGNCLEITWNFHWNSTPTSHLVTNWSHNLVQKFSSPNTKRYRFYCEFKMMNIDDISLILIYKCQFLLWLKPLIRQIECPFFEELNKWKPLRKS